MKIFYLGIFDNKEPQHGLRRALKSIATNGYAEFNWSSAKDIHNLILPIREFKPDVLFCQIQTPNVITKRFLESFNCVKINWTGDVRENIDWYIELAPYFNVTLFTNMTDVKRLKDKKLRSDFLQVSVDDSIYKPTGKHLQFAPIVFFGNNYGKTFPLSEYRYEICSQLKRDYGNRFAIFGKGWHGLESGDLNHQQEKEAIILRGAKIALSISHFNYERYFSDRLLRAMFCRCAVISHHYKLIESDFNVCVELLSFKTYERLKHQIDLILEHDSIHRAISHNGYIAASHRFSYQNFSENLLEIINKYK